MMRGELSESSSSSSSHSASLTRFAASPSALSWFDVSMLHDMTVSLSHVSGPARSPEYILNASLVAFGHTSRYYISKSYSSMRGFRRAILRALDTSRDGSCRCQGALCAFSAIQEAYLNSHKLSCIELFGIGIKGSAERKQGEVAAFVTAVVTAMHAIDRSVWSNQCQFLKLIAYFFETQASTKSMNAKRSLNLPLSLTGWHKDRTLNYGAGITYD
ncbi:hypothetical protein AC1031_021141 [Aphanomyces cochlioides]|nr:hypothetical protein AC1031_021141 [Aphanomyces cochlioides]